MQKGSGCQHHPAEGLPGRPLHALRPQLHPRARKGSQLRCSPTTAQGTRLEPTDSGVKALTSRPGDSRCFLLISHLIGTTLLLTMAIIMGTIIFFIIVIIPHTPLMMGINRTGPSSTFPIPPGGGQGGAGGSVWLKPRNSGSHSLLLTILLSLLLPLSRPPSLLLLPFL